MRARRETAREKERGKPGSEMDSVVHSLESGVVRLDRQEGVAKRTRTRYCTALPTPFHIHTSAVVCGTACPTTRVAKQRSLLQVRGPRRHDMWPRAKH